jgi:hypothetical protein
MKKSFTKTGQIFCFLLMFGLINSMVYTHGQITNPGFETGDITGWTGSSNAAAITTVEEWAWTITPADSYMGIVWPTVNLLKPAAETNLGLTAGSLVVFNADVFDPATNFGTLTQNLTLSAGQSFTIYFNFLSEDYDPYNDGALVTLVGPSFQEIHLVGVTADRYGNDETFVVGDFGCTGWRSLTFTAGAAGVYTLGFACFNCWDQSVNPVLFVDNAPGTTVLADPIAIVPSEDPICKGSSTTLWVVGEAGPIYWYTEGCGGAFVDIGYDITVNPTVTTTYYARNFLSGQYSNGCASYTVTVAPIPEASITGPAQVCVLGEPGLFRTETGMNNYVWIASAGGRFVTGNGAYEAQVVWDTPGPQTVSVTYLSPFGCSPAAPATKAVTVNAQPVPVINGTNSTCLDGVQHIYTTQTGMTNYVWEVPASGTIVSGQGTNEIEVEWSIEGRFWVSVNYTNASGCTAAEPAVQQILLYELPRPAGSITGLTTYCGPVSEVEYAVDRITGADTYIWQVPEGAQITSGRGSWSIRVNYPNPPYNGAVSVYAQNSCGVGETSPALPINIYAIPEKPIIRLENRIFSSSAPEGNQWYKDDELIPGATGQTYSPVLSGDYWTVVTVQNCVSEPSNVIHYIGVGIDYSQLIGFTVYPVPSDGQVNVSFATSGAGKYTLTIINCLGSKVFEEHGTTFPGGTTRYIDLSGSVKGLYFITISTKEGSAVRKVILL